MFLSVPPHRKNGQRDIHYFFEFLYVIRQVNILIYNTRGSSILHCIQEI
jgi:hypothetical protein